MVSEVYTVDSRQYKESALLLGGGKWLKARVCLFQRKAERFSSLLMPANHDRGGCSTSSPCALYFLWHFTYFIWELGKLILKMPPSPNHSTNYRFEGKLCTWLWLLLLSRYNSIMMTQLRQTLKAKQANRKKMINNEAKTTVEENKAVHNKWENRQSVSLRER